MFDKSWEPSIVTCMSFCHLYINWRVSVYMCVASFETFRSGSFGGPLGGPVGVGGPLGVQPEPRGRRRRPAGAPRTSPSPQYL